MSDVTCSVDGCEQPVTARGWCRRHYQRWRLKGDPGPAGLVRLPDGSTCTVDGCNRPNVARGFCEMHRWRVRAYGEPGGPRQKKKRRTAAPKICKVDGCDRLVRGPKPGNYGGNGYCKLHYDRVRKTGEPGPAGKIIRPKGNGHVDKKGYRRIILPDGRRIMEHDHVMEEHLGRRLRPGETVHHKNGMRADNDLSNLELWVKVQPRGQRVADLLEFVVRQYPDELREMLAA